MTANWQKNTPPPADPIQYTIDYKLAGGKDTVGNPTSAKYGDTVTISAPVRVGYSFEGWKSNYRDGLGKHATAGGRDWNGNPTKETKFSNLKDESGTVTLTATWEPKSYEIVYVLDGGNCSNCPKSAKFDEEFTISNPTKDGYVFKGWVSVDGSLGNNAKVDGKAWTGVTRSLGTRFINLRNSLIQKF